MELATTDEDADAGACDECLKNVDALTVFKKVMPFSGETVGFCLCKDCVAKAFLLLP